MNALVAFRQGWTDFFSGSWLIATIVGLLGARAETIEAYFILAMISQVWLHNEWRGNAGLLGWILNTPSHHRVHHSVEHMNANYGEIFIIWDRLFGTFKAERTVRIGAFGLKTMPTIDANPVAIAFGEWRAMFHDWFIGVRRATREGK